jgi:hypothetical protein
MTLIENLVTIVIISILAAMLSFTISKSYKSAKEWILGSYALQESRINAVLEENDDALNALLNEKVQPRIYLKP